MQQTAIWLVGSKKLQDLQDSSPTSKQYAVSREPTTDGENKQMSESDHLTLQFHEAFLHFAGKWSEEHTDTHTLPSTLHSQRSHMMSHFFGSKHRAGQSCHDHSTKKSC